MTRRQASPLLSLFPLLRGRCHLASLVATVQRVETEGLRQGQQQQQQAPLLCCQHELRVGWRGSTDGRSHRSRAPRLDRRRWLMMVKVQEPLLPPPLPHCHFRAHRWLGWRCRLAEVLPSSQPHSPVIIIIIIIQVVREKKERKDVLSVDIRWVANVKSRNQQLSLGLGKWRNATRDPDKKKSK